MRVVTHRAVVSELPPGDRLVTHSNCAVLALAAYDRELDVLEATRHDYGLFLDQTLRQVKDLVMPRLEDSIKFEILLDAEELGPHSHHASGKLSGPPSIAGLGVSVFPSSACRGTSGGRSLGLCAAKWRGRVRRLWPIHQGVEAVAGPLCSREWWRAQLQGRTGSHPLRRYGDADAREEWTNGRVSRQGRGALSSLPRPARQREVGSISGATPWVPGRRRACCRRGPLVPQ